MPPVTICLRSSPPPVAVTPPKNTTSGFCALAWVRRLVKSPWPDFGTPCEEPSMTVPPSFVKVATNWSARALP